MLLWINRPRWRKISSKWGDAVYKIPVAVFMIFFVFTAQGLAETQKEFNKRNEDVAFEMGYTTIEEAIDTCEKHYGKQIVLPYKVPAIPFSIKVGRCSTELEGERNDGFEVKYIHMNAPDNHFMIWVKPNKYGLNLTDKKFEKRFKLDNGSEALYYTNAFLAFNAMVFERDGWQYVMTIDKKVSDEVPPEALVEIANAFR